MIRVPLCACMSRVCLVSRLPPVSFYGKKPIRRFADRLTALNTALGLHLQFRKCSFYSPRTLPSAVRAELTPTSLDLPQAVLPKTKPRTAEGTKRGYRLPSVPLLGRRSPSDCTMPLSGHRARQPLQHTAPTGARFRLSGADAAHAALALPLK